MQQNWSMTIRTLTSRILTVKVNQGTKFGTVEKPMFSLSWLFFLIIISRDNKTKYSGHDFQWAMFEVTRLLTRLQSPLFLPIEVDNRSYPQIPHNPGTNLVPRVSHLERPWERGCPGTQPKLLWLSYFAANEIVKDERFCDRYGWKI